MIWRIVNSNTLQSNEACLYLSNFLAWAVSSHWYILTQYNTVVVLMHNAGWARPEHSYWDIEPSCSAMEGHRTGSWVPVLWTYYNRAEATAYSRGAPSLLQGDAEPVAKLGTAQPFLTNTWNSGTCPSEEWAWRPCSQPEIKVFSKEMQDSLEVALVVVHCASIA